MLLRSAKLHYPLTITRRYVEVGTDVNQGEKLFQYSYKTTVEEDDKYGDRKEVQKDFYDDFLSSVDGTVGSWLVRKGDVIGRDGLNLVEIDEPCKHENQFGGLCADCGKDMTEVNYTTVDKLTDRATVTLSHAHTELKVSRSTATKFSTDSQRRLLSSRKLSLVVDLDQTIIHATVDPTVAEWQKDTENPNHSAVEDVRAFQLIDDGPGGRGCWYYIKLRPGLLQFLDTISKMYELHIYTMGTRAYAQNIAKIIDPDRRIFADRILSRDENGSMNAKSLGRLFPCDTKMVVIIDDRADVWHWSANLIKVIQFDFFVGIGDINSSFLPKLQALPASSTTTEDADSTLDSPAESPVDSGYDSDVAKPTLMGNSLENTESDEKLTEIGEKIIAMAGDDNPEVLQEKNTQQEHEIAAQVEDKPLLRAQQLLDKMDEAEAARDDEGTPDADATHHNVHRHNLLRDDDTELMRLEENLRQVHANFYRDYDENLARIKGSRVAQLRGQGLTKGRRLDERSDLEKEEELNASVPDIKYIMPAMKREILAGVSLVMSGVVPLTIDPQVSDIGRWAKSFGAVIETDISRRTTHVVATRQRKTAKVKLAAKRPKIHIVALEWLLDTFSRWERPPEEPYRIVVEPDAYDPMRVVAPDMGNELSGSDSDSDAEWLASNTASRDGDGEGLKINTKDLTEPDLSKSPVEASTWADIDKELEEFMEGVSSDSEADEEDEHDADGPSPETNTENADLDGALDLRQKRKRSGSDSSNGTASSSDSESAADEKAALRGHGSRLQKRRKKAFERVSSLTNVAIPDELESNPVPAINGDAHHETNADEEEEFNLEAEFEREMEKELEAELEG